jgi:hypothetical protein
VSREKSSYSNYQKNQKNQALRRGQQEKVSFLKKKLRVGMQRDRLETLDVQVLFSGDLSSSEFFQQSKIGQEISILTGRHVHLENKLSHPDIEGAFIKGKHG